MDIGMSYVDTLQYMDKQLDAYGADFKPLLPVRFRIHEWSRGRNESRAFGVNIYRCDAHNFYHEQSRLIGFDCDCFLVPLDHYAYHLPGSENGTRFMVQITCDYEHRIRDYIEYYGSDGIMVLPPVNPRNEFSTLILMSVDKFLDVIKYHMRRFRLELIYLLEELGRGEPLTIYEVYHLKGLAEVLVGSVTAAEFQENHHEIRCCTQRVHHDRYKFVPTGIQKIDKSFPSNTRPLTVEDVMDICCSFGFLSEGTQYLIKSAY